MKNKMLRCYMLMISIAVCGVCASAHAQDNVEQLRLWMNTQNDNHFGTDAHSNDLYTSYMDSRPESIVGIDMGLYIPVGEANEMKLNWQVRYRDGNIALMVCENIIDYRAFSDENTNWRETDLFHFLNEEFYEMAFSEDEKIPIINTDKGYIFLLTDVEVQMEALRFGTSDLRVPIRLADDLEKLTANPRSWWLMPDGLAETSEIPYVNDTGEIAYDDAKTIYGIRPTCIMRIDMVKLEPPN